MQHVMEQHPVMETEKPKSMHSKSLRAASCHGTGPCKQHSIHLTDIRRLNICQTCNHPRQKGKNLCIPSPCEQHPVLEQVPASSIANVLTVIHLTDVRRLNACQTCNHPGQIGNKLCIPGPCEQHPIMEQVPASSISTVLTAVHRTRIRLA